MHYGQYSQFSTAQFNGEQHIAAQRGVLHFSSAVRRGTLQCYTIPSSAVQRGPKMRTIVLCGVEQGGAIHSVVVLVGKWQICENKSVHRILMEVSAPLVLDSCVQYSMTTTAVFYFILF